VSGAGSHARPTTASDADGERIAGPGRRRTRRDSVSVGHAGALRTPPAHCDSYRYRFPRGLARTALYPPLKRGERAAAGSGPGVGCRAAPACQCPQGRRCAGPAGPPLDPAKHARGGADRHVGDSAFDDGTLFAQSAERGQHRHRLSHARIADDVCRSAGSRLHGGADSRAGCRNAWRLCREWSRP
jgi:hypothetical protein